MSINSPFRILSTSFRGRGIQDGDSNNGCVAQDNGIVGTTDASTDEDTLGRVTEDVLVGAMSAMSARK